MSQPPTLEGKTALVTGQITEAEFDMSFAVNVKGVFHGLQLAWLHLAEAAGSSRSPGQRRHRMTL